MLSQLFTVITVLGVVSAAPGGITQCNTGPVQCCSNLQTADSPVSNTLGGILGAALGPVDALIGLGCTPITVIGLSQGANCAQQPVCCTGTQFNGLVNVGCTPVSL